MSFLLPFDCRFRLKDALQNLLRWVTGWEVTADELREVARRIVSAKRQVNVLAGWTLEEDTLPERLLNTPLPSDPAAVMSRERLQELVAESHRQRDGKQLSGSGRLLPCANR